MVRRFFKDSAIYAAANIAARGLSLFMVPYYVRVLDDSDIGTLDILLAWGAMAAVVTGLEISIGMSREYAGQKDDAARCEVSSTALWFSVVVYGLFLAVVALSAGPVARLLLGDERHAATVIAAAATVAAGGVFVIISQQLRYLLKPGLFAITSLVNAVTGLCATVTMVSWLRLGVVGVFLGNLTGLVVGCVLASYFTRGGFCWLFSGLRCRQLLRFSLPLIPSSIAAVVSLHFGRVALDQLLSRDAVGVYGIAARLGGMITLVMAGFNSAMAPLVFSRHEDVETPRALARIFHIFCGVALAGSAGFILFSPEVLHILTTPKYSGALTTVIILAPAALLSQMYIFAPGAWIRKKTWCISAVNITAATLNVALNWMLIPMIGLQGAACAALLGATVSFTASMAVSQYFYPVPHQWRQLGLAFFGAAALTACGLLTGGTTAWQGIVLRAASSLAALVWIYYTLGFSLPWRRSGAVSKQV